MQLGSGFNLFIGVRDLFIEIFDWCRQIAGENFRGVVIHRHDSNTIRVELRAVKTIFNKSQCMSNKGHLQAVFRQIFSFNIAHERPALNQS